MARTKRELTDAQWAKLAPLLPPRRPRMGRPPKDHRLIVEAIVWLDRTGAPWRDLPSQFGPWETVASRFLPLAPPGHLGPGLGRAAGRHGRPRRAGLAVALCGRVGGAGPPARCRCQAAAGHGRPGHGGLWSILTSRAIGIGRRWAAAAAATPPSCTFGSKVGAGRW